MELHRCAYPIVHATKVTTPKLLDGSIRRIDTNKVIVTSGYALVKTSNGEVKAELGEWIVRLHHGELLVLPHILFKLFYNNF